jgi:hypothetical protein
MAMAEQLDAEVREIQKPAAVLACIQCADHCEPARNFRAGRKFRDRLDC